MGEGSAHPGVLAANRVSLRLMGKLRGIVLLLAVGLLGSCEIPSTRRSCCRVCESGKACGDSCISRSSTCNRPAGCACNGAAPDAG